MPKNAYAWLSSRDSVEEKERGGKDCESRTGKDLMNELIGLNKRMNA